MVLDELIGLEDDHSLDGGFITVETAGGPPIIFVDTHDAIDSLGDVTLWLDVGHRIRMYDDDGKCWQEETTGMYCNPDYIPGELHLPPFSIREWLLKVQQLHGDLVCAGCGGVTPEPFLDCDHILPRSDGGRDELYNQILLCRPCNIRKSNVYTLSGLRGINRREGKMVSLQDSIEIFERVQDAKRPLHYGRM